MRKHLLLCFLIVVLLNITIGLGAQLQVLYQDFESGIPSDWSQLPTEEESVWLTGPTGLSNVGAQHGNAYAFINSSTAQRVVKLQTPLIDVSSLTSSQLSYYAAAPSNSLGQFDTLKIYGRTSLSGVWQLLQTEATALPTWQHRELSLESLGGQFVQLAFEYNYGNGKGLGLDQVVIGNGAHCEMPTGLRVVRITSSGATVMCVPSGEPLQFHLKVSTVPMLDPNALADVVNDSVYYFPQELTGLQPNTTYYVYVKADCGNGDVSGWTPAETFTTLCSSMSLPIVQDFESGSLADCWSSDFSYTGDWGQFVPDSRLRPACSSVESRGRYSYCLNGLFDNDVTYRQPRATKSALISPRVATSDMTGVDLTFWVKSASTHDVMTVGLLSDPQDMSTFYTLGDVKVGSANVWEKVIVPVEQVSDSSLKYVAFVVDGSEQIQTATFYIDDVSFNVAPGCPQVSLIRASMSTSDEVMLQWRSRNASQWEVKISTTPLTDMSEAGNVKDVVVNNPSLLLSELQPLTSYYVYVRSLCGVAQGDWSSVYAFTTPCAVASAFPVVEGFESYASGTFPTCWNNPVEYLNYPQVFSKSINGSSKVLMLKSEPGSATYAVSPALGSTLNSLEMDFVLAAQPNSHACHVQVGYMLDKEDVSTFVAVADIHHPDEQAMEYSVRFDTVTVAGMNRYIAFKHLSTSPNDGVYIDDVMIDSIPSCVAPTAVRTSALTSTSATLNWSAAQGETRWHVKVSFKTLARPWESVGEFFDDTVSTTSVSLQDLTMGVEYQVYIQSLCDDEGSKWGHFSFQTPCAAITALPYVESFTLTKGVEDEYVPCWSYLGEYSPSITTEMNATLNEASSHALSLRATYYAQDMYAVMPMIDIPGKTLGDMQLSFAYRGNYSATGSHIIIGTMSDPGNSNTFVAIDTLYATVPGDFTRFYDISLSSYRGTGKYLAFRVNYGLNDDASLYSVLDDVRLDLISGCARVHGMTTSDVNDVDVTVNWPNDNGANQWEAVIGRRGFKPETETAVSVNDTLCRFSGLTPSTEYDVYVRANCGAVDGVSLWSDVLRIKTLTTPEKTPIATDFSSEEDNGHWIINNGTQTNHWVIGTGVSGSDTALYISVDEGLNARYDYDGKSESYAYAYRYVHFNPGAYKISYEWKAPFESYTDGARICLVDKSTPLEAGQHYGMRSGNNTLPAGWLYDLSEGLLLNSSTWSRQEQIVTFADTVNYKLVLFWKNYKYGDHAESFALNNLVIEELDCVPASDLTATMTDTSALVSWTRFDKVALWDVYLDTVAVDMAQDLVHVFLYNDSVGVNRVSLTGLSAQTTYYVYVRPHCADGSYESWRSLSFTTDCSGLYELPYEENFEQRSTFESCWKHVLHYNDYPYVNSDVNHSFDGSQSLQFGSNSQPTSVNLVTMPRMDADSVKHMLMQFWLYSYSYGSSIEVGVMTNPEDASTFEVVDRFSTESARQWLLKKMSFKDYTGNGQYIAFRSGNTNSSNFLWLDDIRVEDNRSCEQPSQVNVSRLSQTSAKLAWLSGNGNCLYNLKVSTEKINPELNSGNVLDISELQDNYYMFQQTLQPNTEYYVYVQSDCGDEKGSYWSKEFVFTTLCEGASLSYKETFEEVLGDALPSCWLGKDELKGEVNASYLPQVVTLVDAGLENRVLKLSCFYEKKKSNEVWNISSSTSVALLPVFSDSLSNLYVQFDHKSSLSSGVLKVGVFTDLSDMSTFTTIDSVSMGDWQHSSVSLSSYTGNGILAFVFDGDRNGLSGDAYIDNVEVDYLSGCKVASALWSEKVTNNGGDIVWKPLTSSDSIWHVQVSEFDAGSTPSLLDNRQDFVIDTIVVGSRLQMSGLMSSTTYYYYVRPVCAGVDGPRFGTSKSFRTLCDALSLPYSENFDDGVQVDDGGYDDDDDYGYGDDDDDDAIALLPECWLGFSNQSEEVSPTISNYNSLSGSQSLYFKSTAGTYSYVVLPLFDVASVQQLSISFSGYSTESGATLQLGVMDDPLDVNSFQVQKSVQLDEEFTWEKLEYVFSNYSGQGQYLALRSMSNEDNEIYIDDVLIKNEEGCNPPMVVTVEKIDKSSALVSWSKESIESTWDIAYGEAGFDLSTSTPIETHKSMHQLTNLSSGMSYDVYVRTVCGDGEFSSWTGPYQFATLVEGSVVPMHSDFESSTEGWILENGLATNEFVIGSATHYSGSQSLYVSENQGASDSYDGYSESIVYAYKLLHFEPGVYNIKYYWTGEGESAFDYGRAFLAPQSTVITAGQSICSSYVLPAGSIALDHGSVLSDSYSWTLSETGITIDEPTDYKVVFAWRNDESDGGETSLAIDSFSVSAADCFEPIVKLDSVSSTSANLKFYFSGDSLDVKVSTAAVTEGLEGALTGDVFDGKCQSDIVLSNLTPDATYYIYLRSLCTSGDSTGWTRSVFTTECGVKMVNDSISYIERFDSSTPNSSVVPCWTLLSGSDSALPIVLSNSPLGSSSLKLRGKSTAYSCAVTPRLGGCGVDKMQVKFMAMVNDQQYSVLVGVMSNPNDINSFVEIASITCSEEDVYEEQIVDMSNYCGEGQYIAFLAGGSSKSTVFLDNIEISEQSLCSAPTVLKATQVKSNSFKLSWNSKEGVPGWHVKVFSNRVEAQPDMQADVLDSVVTTAQVMVLNVSASSCYTVFVKSVCAGADSTDWSKALTVHTMCGASSLPYKETFGVKLPECWDLYQGLLSDVLVRGNLLPTYEGWEISSNGPLTGSHAKINVTDNDIKHWLVTNEVVLDGAVQLSFDLALTGSDGSSAVTSSVGLTDDRFAVVISTTDGVTWDSTHQTVWNDVAGTYAYSTIPNGGRHYSINLVDFIGKNIRVGFYAESTSDFGDVMLHLDNVAVEPLASVTICDTVCQGYAYVKHGFTVAASELQTVGTYSFTRVVANAAGEDSVTVAQLTVKPSAYSTLNATMCAGDIYNQNGFMNLTTSGVYTLSVTAANGCDSIVTLNLLVAPTYDMTDSVRIQLSDLPYSYGDTTFVAGTVAGEYHYDYHGQTEQACDSLVHLVLTIDGITEVDEIGVINLSMYPNPLQKSGVTYIYGLTSAIDLNGVVVEVLNSVGQCVRTIRPTEQPIAVDGFETSGIYIVRVTTADGSVYFGKIMAQ